MLLYTRDAKGAALQAVIARVESLDSYCTWAFGGLILRLPPITFLHMIAKLESRYGWRRRKKEIEHPATAAIDCRQHMTSS